MTKPDRSQRRDVQVLQAPGQASLRAWTENVFLAALQHPTTGLPKVAYHQLAALHQDAQVLVAGVQNVVPLRALVPGPGTTQERARRTAHQAWAFVKLRERLSADDDVLQPWREWAKRWRINAPCVVWWAVTASVLQQQPAPGSMQFVSGVGAIPATVPTDKLSVSVHGHMLRDTEDEFVSLAREAYRAAYRYLRGKHDFEPLHPHPKMARYCDWTVAAYVHERPATSIAADAGVQPDAVNRALKVIADRIELPRRARGRRRPKIRLTGVGA